MFPVEKAFEEFDYNVERLQQAEIGTVEQRTALDGALTNLYQLREHLKSSMESNKAFYALTQESADGLTSEGVVGARNLKTHQLAQPIPPAIKNLLPGAFTLPGSCTFPGANLTWLDPDEIDFDFRFSNKEKNSLKRYREGAVGKTVLQTLDLSRRFYRSHTTS